MGKLKLKEKPPEKQQPPGKSAPDVGVQAPAGTGGNALAALATPIDNKERSAQIQEGREAKQRFDSYDVGPLVIERYEQRGAPCGLKACHADPVRKWTFLLEPLDLEGKKQVPLSQAEIEMIWPSPNTITTIPVRWGTLAKGSLEILRDDYSLHTWGRQELDFFHPAMPPRSGVHPAMAIDIAWGAISGELTQAYKPIDEAQAAKLLGLEDFHELKVGAYTNKIEQGRFTFDLAGMQFKLDGLFPGTGAFSAADATPLAASAEIEATGIAKQAIPIERDPQGLLSANKPLTLSLKPAKTDGSWNGNLEARFGRGVYDIRGTIDYTSPKGEIRGKATLLLTDKRRAWAAIKQRLGAAAPVGLIASESDTGMALVGWGVLDFDLSAWLKGTVEVVVDPDGYITTRGRLEPTVEYTLFDKKVIPSDSLPGTSMEIPSIPLVGNYIRVSGGFSFEASAWYGPAKLQDIKAGGVYSTNPQIPTEFDVAASLTLPASGTLTLKVWGKIAIGTETFNAGITISLTGKATMNAYAESKLAIARRRKPGATDGATEYVVSGDLEFAAALECALEGSIELNVLWAKWELVKLQGRTWHVGDFGVGLGFDHVIGSGKLPKARLGNKKGDVTFNDYKFMKAAAKNEAPSGSERSVDQKEAFTPKKSARDLPAAHTPTAGVPDLEPAPATQAAGPLGAIDDATVTPPRERTRLATGDQPAAVGDAPVEQAAFDMDGEPHTLFLVFDDPPRVYMMSPPPGEQLSLKLGATLKTLCDQIAAGNAADRTLQSLSDEATLLESLVRDCVQVEYAAARLGLHPSQDLPEHVPGFPELAGRLRAYGRMYDREDLIATPAAKAAPDLPAATRPADLKGKLTPRLDELSEQRKTIEPDIANRYVREYQDYLVNGGTMPLLRYLEGRAARRLGNITEPTMIKKFEQEVAGPSSKLDFEIVDSTHKDPDRQLRHRIPDIYVPGTALGDVKDVEYQSLDEQMRDNLLISAGGEPVRKLGTTDWIAVNTTRLKFYVIVRMPSHLQAKGRVSDPLEQAVKATDGAILPWIRDPKEK